LVSRGVSKEEYIPAARDLFQQTFVQTSESELKPMFDRFATGFGASKRDIESAWRQKAFSAPQPNPLGRKGQGLCATFEVLGEGGHQARTFFIYASPVLSLGRHSRNDLVLYWYPLPEPADSHNPEWQNWKGSGNCHPSLNISGHHLDLMWREEALWIRDNSSKGTFLEGLRVPGKEWLRLEHGATVGLADVLQLSYTRLLDMDGRPAGWRLRRVNNAAGYEEYLFLESGALVSLGRDAADAIVLSDEGVASGHMALGHEDGLIRIRAENGIVTDNSGEIEEERTISQSLRLQVGEQAVWCFPV